MGDEWPRPNGLETLRLRSNWVADRREISPVVRGLAVRKRCFALALVAVLSGGWAPISAEEPDKPALHLAAGTIARSQLVAMGRDLLVEGEALSDVAVVQGTARVVGSIAGDLIVLGGNAELEGNASVAGDVYVLGGEVTVAPGGEIGGRTVAYPTASEAWITLLEGPSLGLSASSPVVLGAKVALMGAWLALALVLFATAGREVVATSQSIAASPFQQFRNRIDCGELL